MNYIAAHAFVTETLKNKLPHHLYYHNPSHTTDVVQAAESIGRQSKINDSDLLLLRTAALFHDTGLIKDYKNHELASVEFAREQLPNFGYSAEAIHHICEIIMATKMPQQPKCPISEILCDADLDYLGRPDYFAVSHKLRLEWMYAIHYEDSLLEWYQKQHDFLSSHQYFTAVSRSIREVGKQNNLRQINELLGIR
jgi:predicted metal-dependent HD superfamily phosphohydrolase